MAKLSIWALRHTQKKDLFAQHTLHNTQKWMEYMPVEAEVSYRDQQSEKVTGIQQDCGEHI